LTSIIVLFTQKIVRKLSIRWFMDSESGTRKKSILDAGSRGQKRSGSATVLAREHAHPYGK
jgi:hypothetical protein